MKVCIINGSSRVMGNTSQITKLLKIEFDAHEYHLTNHQIECYNYEHQYSHEDFYTLMTAVVKYDVILLATPIYWYSMSGHMKNFLDRITDCLKVRKEIGRQLRGKSLAAISCGSESSEVKGYFEPFRLSADYLGMHYLGHVHSWISENEPSNEVKRLVLDFANKLKTTYDQIH